MIFLLLILGGGAAYLFATQAKSTSAEMMLMSAPSNSHPNPLPLPDVISPETQGGKWNRDFDSVFFEMSQRHGVPFALLKAHAIRESALKPNAYLLEPSGKASYGLMQVLWWQNSQRFQKWGYSDDMIRDGTLLYEPGPNVHIAASLIRENWDRFKNLRDIVNAYNTGVAESKRVAPHNYVNDVLKYYSTLVGFEVS